MTVSDNNKELRMPTFFDFVRSVLVVFFLLCSSTIYASGISEWLMRVETAPERLSYTGSFLYEHDGEMESMRVVHRVRNNQFKERLYSLTGSAREIVRDDNSVWCYIPDKQVGVHEYRQSSRNTFLQIRGEQISKLDKYYSLELGELSRVADRQARIISIMPRDDYRYGYELWVDTETGLLLRSDLKDRSGVTIERYMFVEISIGTEISDAELEPMTDQNSLSWFGMDMPKSRSSDGESAMLWDSETLPAGFKLSYSVNRRSVMEDGLVEHHVYSDGLSSVSLFVKNRADGKTLTTGVSRMGAVSAYSTNVDGFDVTVVGEVPESTVSIIATGVARIN